MYAMPKSYGIIIKKDSVRDFSRELNKYRIISPEFAEDCRKMLQIFLQMQCLKWIIYLENQENKIYRMPLNYSLLAFL